jgi:hypothetical protein
MMELSTALGKLGDEFRVVVQASRLHRGQPGRLHHSIFDPGGREYGHAISPALGFFEQPTR